MKYVIILVFLVLVVTGCIKQISNENPKLSEMQITACNSADNAGTCQTKLPELNLVTVEQCCESLNKCC